MTLKEKIVILEKMKDLRDEILNKPRWGVKERWTGNPSSFFRDLQEYLYTHKMSKFERLKRSVIK